MERRTGTISRGIRCPIIREGDNLVQIVTESVLQAAEIDGFELRDRDVIAMTESIVARAQGNYANVKDIADDVKAKFDKESAPEGLKGEKAVYTVTVKSFRKRVLPNDEEFVTVQSCIDEIKHEGKAVFVFATANEMDKLPESLTRSGRFDKIIEMNVPMTADAAKIIKHYKRHSEKINSHIQNGMLNNILRRSHQTKCRTR